MTFLNNKTIGITILIIIVSALSCFAMWDYMREGEFLGKWASVITVISVAVSPIWYFWTRYQDKKDEQDRASRNLYGELKDALEGLDDAKYPDDAVTITYDEKSIFFMNINMNHDIYDSLVSSGKINFLAYDIQQGIQDIFRRIKRHNYYVTLIMELADKENRINKKDLKYCISMEPIERKLSRDIPDMMKKLENDFNIKSIL